jgi:hypothetical protein
MKIKLNTALAAALSSSLLFVAAAHAQSAPASAPASASAAKPAAKSEKKVEKKSTAKAVHHAAPARTASGVHPITNRKVYVRKKPATPVVPVAAIPEGAEKWSCAEGQTLYLKGDMKRDQILTMFYEGKTYQLPRKPTTTGADRFFDLASGMDLVVIPTKAMLFSDKDDDRLADECMTEAMIHNNEPAPTQSNAISQQRQ